MQDVPTGGQEVKSTRNLSVLFLITDCKFTIASKESLIFKNVTRKQSKKKTGRDLNVMLNKLNKCYVK